MADDVKFRLTAEDATRQAFRSVESSLDRIKTSATSVAATFGALAGSAAILAVGQSFNSAVGYLSSLDDAAEETGISVKALSGLLGDLAPSGLGLTEITQTATLFARAIENAGDKTSKQAEFFKALGVSLKDADGNLKSVDVVLRETAAAQAKFADGTEKTTLFISGLGKAGASVIPSMNDLAQAVGDAGVDFTEASRQAEQFEKLMGRFKANAAIANASFWTPIITQINAIAEAFRKADKDGLGFFERLKTIPGANTTQAGNAQFLAAQLARAREQLADLEASPGVGPGRANPASALRMQRDEVAALERQVLASLGRIAAVDGAPPGTTDDRPPAPRARDTSGDSAARKAIEDQIKARRELDELIAQSDVDDRLKQEAAATKLFADATKDLVEQWSKFETIDADARLAPNADELAGLQRYADLLREIRGTDSASRSRDSALDAANRQLASGAISFDEYEKLGSKILGLKDPIAEVAAASKDLFAPIESAFEKALIEGEKLSDVMKSLASDVASVFLRQQVTSPLADLLGGTFDSKKSGGTLIGQIAGFLFGGARADGGPVSAGSAYLVGERGPELFMPKASGAIVPNGGFGGRSIVVHQTNVFGKDTSAAQRIRDAEMTKAATIRAMREAEVRGAA